ncbi:imidazole glycerol phosphate synthase subunit HisH [Sphingomonas ginsenosidimutans]|uniref:Imidazole glycerol phosphate synthase subunit HisH n=1 Tax=Sphingomonas ginsenosidimutans TaxID=862134 RepID=A0A2A4HZL3_9SPHN|nr:imidazole glycerol phosphate synthase subunit HisH [Sphingomonas ginsenosidimutans]MEE2915775.1 imidazole glycerol phosphate synthase subunit HisH [Pseudomonadota bacterium]PCG09107.1 imidazole glycerol phosphate synthase subunit HisH [Sphingomonas ginsenosidimutans]
MISILGYGLGNVKAFQNIYRELNIACVVAEDRQTLAAADRIILPGVGSFDHAMQRLKASGLFEALEDAVLARGTPVLGVCVGMQMLARSSEEGSEPGLGWIDGTVEKIRFPDDAPRGLLPHMGWSTISPRADEPLLAGLDDALGFYFLHSYRFVCDDEADVVATADYATRFHCAVRHGNVHGVQFHPEKSHHNGIRLLKNFAEA